MGERAGARIADRQHATVSSNRTTIRNSHASRSIAILQKHFCRRSILNDGARDLDDDIIHNLVPSDSYVRTAEVEPSRSWTDNFSCRPIERTSQSEILIERSSPISQ